MAKVSSVEKNEHRKELIDRHSEKRKELKSQISDKTISVQERLVLVQKLASLPRNSSKTRYRNRCKLTGRPRGYYSDFGVSRNVLRELASFGRIPGLIKSSW